MKRTIVLIGVCAFIFSCTSTSNSINAEKSEGNISDTLMEESNDSIEPVVIVEKGIQVSEEFLKKFSRELKLPFNVSKRKLESLGEDNIGDYFSKSSNELSVEDITIVDSIWSKGPHSEKFRFNEAAFFANLTEPAYQKYLDSISEWDSQYAKAFAYGTIQLKNELKILVWQFRSGYGDMGTAGSFDAYFGSLVKKDKFLYSFDLGYNKEQGDAPMYLETSFLTKIQKDELFQLNYDTKTMEDDYENDTILISYEEHKKYQGSIINDSIVLKEINKDE